MGLLDSDYAAVKSARPRKSSRIMPGEDIAENAKSAIGLLADFTPVVGGVKGAYEEMKAGNPGMAALNAATVPLDALSLGGSALLKGGLVALGTRSKFQNGLIPHKFALNNLLPPLLSLYIAVNKTPLLLGSFILIYVNLDFPH